MARRPASTRRLSAASPDEFGDDRPDRPHRERLGRAAATGELLVRGPQVMAGCLNRPSATAEIKVDGHQVAPAEVEGLLLTHPSVADAAVIGREDDRHGELPVAYVVADGPLDPPAIVDWLARRTAPYKRLADLVPVDALPRTPSGKLLRRVLRSSCGYRLAN